jgi:hypothetical protein
MLCTINSICIAADTLFPWINRPEPFPLEDWRAFDDYLTMGDTECIYIAIDEAGNLHSAERVNGFETTALRI